MRGKIKIQEEKTIGRKKFTKYQNDYLIELIADKREGGFVAVIPELPGCISQGETLTEALKMIEEAKIAWIRAVLKPNRAKG